MSITTIITSFLTTIDTASLATVQSAYGTLASNISSTFRLMLTLYVVWWGYQILLGKTTAMPLEIAWRIGKIAFIYMLATQWATFSTLVYDVVMQTPDSVGSAIMSASGSSPGENAIATSLNKVYDAGAQLVGRVYVGSYFDLFGAILAGLVLIGMIAFLGACVAILIATKLMLTGLLALAPIFVILALYGYTFRFTDGYLRALAGLMVSMILVYAFLGVYAGLLDKSIAAIGDGTDSVAKFTIILPYLLVCICGFLVIYQIPPLAMTIAGGAGTGIAAGLSVAGMGTAAAWSARHGLKPLPKPEPRPAPNTPSGSGGGTTSTAVAIRDNLARSGRARVVEAEILPPQSKPALLTWRPALPPPGGAAT